MISDKAALLETLESIKGISVLVVGDLILDRYIWGAVERISPEAPVPVVSVERVEDRLGGAGNVVRNLRALGVEVNLCAFVGDDEEGRKMLGLLEAEGVNREGVMIDTSRPTTFKTRVIAHHQQVVRIDREETAVQGVALREGFASMVEAQIEGNKAIVISDYAKGTITAPLMQRLERAKQDGKIGRESRPLVVDPKFTNFDLYKGISLATPNKKEAQEASGIQIIDRSSAEAAAKKLIERWGAEMMVVTLGEDGLLVADPGAGEQTLIDTVAQEVYDVSGAGDAVVAIFSAALAVGASPVVAGDLANIGAGVVVSEIGTVPVNLERLKSEIERLAAKK